MAPTEIEAGESSATLEDMDPQLRRSRALASPIRWRILRVCLHQARTNKEIADILEIAPATCLHHVRTLVDVNFLAAQEPRRGARGAKEIPYLATGETFEGDFRPEVTSEMMVHTTLAEIAGLDPADVGVTRLGYKVPEARREEFAERVHELIRELADEPADPDSDAWSLLLVTHRDPQAD